MTNWQRRAFTRSAALAVLGTQTIARAAQPDDATPSKGSALPERSDSGQPFTVPERLRTHLTSIFGTQEISGGGVSVSLPALAENGNSVALGVAIDRPESAPAIEALYVFSEKNPLPDIARFSFANGVFKEQLALRIRLADSQQIIAVAKAADGQLFAGTADIIVTLAACIDIPQP